MAVKRTMFGHKPLITGSLEVSAFGGVLRKNPLRVGDLFKPFREFFEDFPLSDVRSSHAHPWSVASRPCQTALELERGTLWWSSWGCPKQQRKSWFARTYGRGSKIGTQKGTLVNGNKD